MSEPDSQKEPAGTSGQHANKSQFANSKSQIPLWRLILGQLKRADVLLRASGLAYSTLASLVPLFAILLAVLSGPAFTSSREKVLDQLASALVPDNAAAGNWVIDPDSPQEKFKETFRENIEVLANRLGAVSVFGFLILIATAALLFRSVEKAFNSIWRADMPRPFFLRILITTGLIFWGPVMLAISVSLTEYLRELPVVGTYITPVLFTALAFSGFFMLMPHASVNYRCALAGGVLTSLLCEISKLLFLVYVTRVVSYNRVYGSLGLFPMLLLWIYVNWALILLGAVFAYCLQHRKILESEWKAMHHMADAEEQHGIVFTPTLVLAAAIEIAYRFQLPCPGGVKVSELAAALNVDASVMRQIVGRLVAGGIVARVLHDGEALEANADPAYLPTRETSVCDVTSLLSAAYSEQGLPAGGGRAWDRARALVKNYSDAATAGMPPKLSLADLAVHETPPAQPVIR